MHEMEQYFYSGLVHKSLAAAKLVTKGEPVFDAAQKMIMMLEQYGVHNIPLYTEKERASIERPDETYAEMDQVLAIRSIKDEAKFNAEIQLLEKTAREGTDLEKAQSFFSQGQLFLFAHHYEESVHCFMQAVRHAPNNATYYGIAGQTMARVSHSPFEVLGFLERAIELDEQNARWYWNRALVLMTLHKDLQQELFLEYALHNLEKAQEVLRPEQVSLKSAIDNTFETVKEYLY